MLTEIYNEPLFFNTSSITQIDHSKYLMKKAPPWAREYFQMVRDIQEDCVWLYIDKRTPTHKCE